MVTQSSNSAAPMQSSPQQPSKPAIEWDFTRRGPLFAVGSLAAFALLYALLVVIGLSVHEAGERLTIVWPAAGLLLMALWLSPFRRWAWIIGLQIIIEIAVGSSLSVRYPLLEYLPFPLANSIDGMVGAWIIKRLIPSPREPKLRYALMFVVAAAAGALASAMIGAFGITHAFSAVYAREMQLWWAGNWLGTLCIAPVMMGWLIRWRAPEFSAPVVSAVEITLISLAMLLTSAWVFSASPGTIRSILDMPFVLAAFAVLTAFRAPPRWAFSIAACNAGLVAYFVSQRLGPFAGDPSPFVRIGAAQLYLASLVAINFILTAVLLERRSAFQLLRSSDERYRHFIEHSSEAVWRVELREAMDTVLPVADQITWLHEHAYVAESNHAYQNLNRQLGLSATDSRWRPEAPWAATFIDHLEAAARNDYVMDGAKFTVRVNGDDFTYITEFHGVVVQGRLARIWGVARDVTELVTLNERLRQNQERLRQYARELVSAEERARRATAVDLHDGIGQQLVGLGMTLEALSARAPAEARLLLTEATSTVRDVQGTVQRVIADLSPPGLYELGLEPALKWLSVYMRGKDNLQVELQVDAVDADIDLETRVLVFKVIRELLRNVTRHAGVRAARVSVRHVDSHLEAVVADQGVGFEWQMSLFEPKERGFGLWSIADRVREAGGDISVETGPGRGTRVTVTFPLFPRRGGSESLPDQMGGTGSSAAREQSA